jgi:sugar-specific transcriptional regulator TrmB
MASTPSPSAALPPTPSQMSEKTRRVLQELGLTDYEMKAYLSLLTDPGRQASEISKNSDVPVSKIYDVLSSLERKGWVESQHGRPILYYAKSPSTALQVFRMRLENELKTNEEYVLRELMPLYEKRETQERPDIWIVRGEYNILAKIREAIDRCRKELLVVIPRALSDAIDLVIPTIVSIRASGVSIRILISKDVKDQSLRKISSICDVKVRESMYGGGVICDAKEVVILLGGSPGASGSALAIWSDHESLASFAKDYFEFLWRDASSLKHTPTP